MAVLPTYLGTSRTSTTRATTSRPPSPSRQRRCVLRGLVKTAPRQGAACRLICNDLAVRVAARAARWLWQTPAVAAIGEIEIVDGLCCRVRSPQPSLRTNHARTSDPRGHPSGMLRRMPGQPGVQSHQLWTAAHVPMPSQEWKGGPGSLQGPRLVHGPTTAASAGDPRRGVKPL